jgi:hypothetical protein
MSRSRTHTRKAKKGVKKARKLPNEELDNILNNLLQENNPMDSKDFEEQLFRKIRKDYIEEASDSDSLRGSEIERSRLGVVGSKRK